MKFKTLSVVFALSAFLSGCVALQPNFTRNLKIEMSSTEAVTGLPIYIYKDGHYANKTLIGNLPLSKEILVAEGKLMIFVDDTSEGLKLYPSSSFPIEPNQSSLVVKIDAKKYKDVLAAEFKTFDTQTKRQIIRIITSLDTASETKKMDFDAKVSEAKGEFSILSVENEAFKKSDFASKLRSMLGTLSIANFLGYIDSDFSKNMAIVRQATGL